jgi:hypothetical protein
MGRVLVIGLDPDRIPGYDPEPVKSGLAVSRGELVEQGIEADFCLVDPAGDAEAAITAALTARDDYACVVIGGGIRGHEPLLPLFERVVNLVRRHAPAAAIAFNRHPGDIADAAARWL